MVVGYLLLAWEKCLVFLHNIAFKKMDERLLDYLYQKAKVHHPKIGLIVYSLKDEHVQSRSLGDFSVASNLQPHTVTNACPALSSQS